MDATNPAKPTRQISHPFMTTGILSMKYTSSGMEINWKRNCSHISSRAIKTPAKDPMAPIMVPSKRKILH
jgi:hypothetical protein